MTSAYQRLIGSNFQVILSHVYCEANKVADAIANRGIGTEEEFLLYEQQPDFLDLLLLRMFWDFNLPEL